jgi:hypothetical protein
LHPGLCARCAHLKVLETKSGNPIILCRLSEENSDYPRYPALPVLECAGFRAGD